MDVILACDSVSDQQYLRKFVGVFLNTLKGSCLLKAIYIILFVWC